MCCTLSKEEQWRKVPWNKFDSQIRKIQERIYDASVRNDLKTVRTLQKVLVGLTPAKFIAVRRINQDNRGKRTAGVDEIVSLTATQCIDLVNELKIDGKADSIRRVFIPRPDGRQRPLGIPTMKDRAKQFLLLMTLEPEWEAKFEPNSYGFRPGRSCQDARAAICHSLQQKAKYVYDADIEQFFPSIAHEPLLDKLDTIPRFRKQIRSWLKAGITFESITEPSIWGTPQGNPISPLLVNVALHGLEKHVEQCLATWSKNCELPKGSEKSKILTLRYADNFVILSPHLEVLERVVSEVEMFLIPMGLQIYQQNSNIRHTLHKYNGQNAGFAFLGFYFQNTVCGIGKTMWVANKNVRKPFKYYLSQTPDRDRVQKHIDYMRNIIKRMEKRPQEELIGTLNRIIQSWTLYYAFTDNYKIFNYCDRRLFWRLYRYACNRHKSKGKKWIINRYFHTIKGRKWIFATPDRKLYVNPYSKRVSRKRYVKVIQGKSPYDGDTRYWGNRWKMAATPEKRKLYDLQNGKCSLCQGPILVGQMIEAHHLVLQKNGESDSLNNFRLVHIYCHDQIHGH